MSMPMAQLLKDKAVKMFFMPGRVATSGSFYYVNALWWVESHKIL